MKKKLFKRITFLSLLSLIFLTISCGVKSVEAVFVSDTFIPGSIDNIFVLPIVDFSNYAEEEDDDDEKAEMKVEINEYVQEWIVYTLEDRNYKYTVLNDLTLTEDITKMDIENMNPAGIKQLGPQNARWILLPILGASESDPNFFNTTGDAVVSGYLFDKENGMKIWYNEGIGEAEGGGLLGLALASSYEKDAIMFATILCFAGLPEKES